MLRRFGQWLSVHREAITSIAVIVLILAGLIIIWGGGDEGQEESMGVATTETSLIPPISMTAPNTWEREWSGAWRHIEEESRRTTTTRASRKAKTRTVLPNHATTPTPIPADIWGDLARCESGGNPLSVSAPDKNGNRYYGAFQFLPSTWRSVGMSGLPTDYSYGEQLAAAQRLQARSGWGQWPRCSRRLGLR